MTILELAELMDQSASECAEEAKETRSWPDQDEALTMHADRLDWHVKKYRATAAALRALAHRMTLKMHATAESWLADDMRLMGEMNRLLQEIKS